MPILDGLSGRDVNHLNLLFDAPGHEAPAGDFASIVHADSLWLSAPFDDRR